MKHSMADYQNDHPVVKETSFYQALPLSAIAMTLFAFPFRGSEESGSCFDIVKEQKRKTKSDNVITGNNLVIIVHFLFPRFLL